MEVAAVAAAVVPRDHVVAVVAAAAVVAGPRNTPPGAAHRGRRWARRLQCSRYSHNLAQHHRTTIGFGLKYNLSLS